MSAKPGARCNSAVQDAEGDILGTGSDDELMVSNSVASSHVNRHCVNRCDAVSGAMPASRSRSAVVAKALAASSVICRLVRAGLKLSGASKQRRSNSRLAGSANWASVTTWRSLGVPLKWV